MDGIQAVYLVIQILSGIITFITVIAVVTGKAFFIKTHTRVMLDKQEERIVQLERESSENKHTHALLLKCSMVIIEGMKRGKMNGDLDDVEEEINNNIYAQIGGNRKH
jgi:hypothetical protein